MIISEIDICNRAIDFVGGQRINSLDEKTAEAEACFKTYDIERNYCLSVAAWPFAIKQVLLNREINTTIIDGKYRYVLPDDCIRPLFDNDQLFQEDNYILSSEPNGLYIKYIYENKNPSTYSPTFVKFLYYRLAAQIAKKLTNNDSLAREAYSLSERELAEAKKQASFVKKPVYIFDIHRSKWDK